MLLIGLRGLGLLLLVVIVIARRRRRRSRGAGATAEHAERSPGQRTHRSTLPGIAGQRAATAAEVFNIKMPFAMTLLQVQATARASGGTTPTLTVDVQHGPTTVLDDPIAITAGTVSEGTLVVTEIPDEAEVTIDLAIGGTSPTWDDISVTLVGLRK